MDVGVREEYEKEAGGAFTDSLTGLYTHGLFRITFDRELARSKRTGESFALLFIDVDLFSSFNRLNGPAKADGVLKKVGELIGENIRDVDFAARFGGDVFALLLPRSDAENSVIAGERIRKAVSGWYSGGTTVSVGVAAFPEDGEDREALIGRGMEALRQAKVSGKDRVHYFRKEEAVEEGERPRILIVDDDRRNVKLLEAHLHTLNCTIFKAYNGEDALSLIRKEEVDLVMLDVMMPGMDGYAVCGSLKSNESTRMIPVILITALDDVEAKVRGIESGADDFITKPPNREELLARTRSLVHMRKLNKSLTSIENVLFSLANAVEAKDPYTEGHIKRVANLAVDLGKRLGLGEREVAALRLGGILHDVGKIGVPKEILNKPGPLTEEEFTVIKSHTELGHRICLPLMTSIGPALDVIRHHHEKLSGGGYPDGLKGSEVSMASRVMAVVDIYDALVTDRPYRKGMEKGKACAILEEEASEGKLDGHVVKCLVGLIKGEGTGKTNAEESGEQKRPEPPESARRGEVKSTSPKAVLVIEDESLNRKLIRVLLQGPSLNVLEAQNAEEGLRIARESRPDLVLMDIQLPGMDGLTATRKLKADPELGRIPVVALSAYAMKNDMENAEKAGCAGYIAKPIDIKKFMEVVFHHIGLKIA